MHRDDPDPAVTGLLRVAARGGGDVRGDGPPASLGRALRAIPLLDGLDAAIATLLVDAAVEPELAGMRGGTVLRSLEYAAGPLAIRIDVDLEGDKEDDRLVTVELDPPAVYVIEIVQRGSAKAVTTDAAGVAEFAGLRPGPAFVVVRPADGSPSATTDRFVL